MNFKMDSFGTEPNKLWKCIICNGQSAKLTSSRESKTLESTEIST